MVDCSIHAVDSLAREHKGKGRARAVFETRSRDALLTGRWDVATSCHSISTEQAGAAPQHPSRRVCSHRRGKFRCWTTEPASGEKFIKFARRPGRSCNGAQTPLSAVGEHLYRPPLTFRSKFCPSDKISPVRSTDVAESPTIVGRKGARAVSRSWILGWCAAPRKHGSWVCQRFISTSKI